MTYEIMNALVTLAVITAMFVIFVHAMTFKTPKSLVYRDHPSTTWAFVFFGATWTFTFIVYGVIFLFGNHVVGATLMVLRIIDNIAKLSLLATAIAYSRGEDFDLKITSAWLGVMFVGLTLWEVICYGLTVASNDNMFFAVMQVAPDIVISSIAIVAVGWVLFVRWGGAAGWLYLLTTVGYAILQFPASIKIGLRAYLAPSALKNLDVAFSLLAGGKILLAFGFVLLIWNAQLPNLNVDKPKLWPTKSVKVPKWMYQSVGWLVSLTASVAASVLSEPLKAQFGALLKSVLH